MKTYLFLVLSLILFTAQVSMGATVQNTSVQTGGGAGTTPPISAPLNSTGGPYFSIICSSGTTLSADDFSPCLKNGVPYQVPTYFFTITSGNATAGAVYTNNSHNFTVTSTIAGELTLGAVANGAPSGTILTLSTGTGDATITFSAFRNVKGFYAIQTCGWGPSSTPAAWQAVSSTVSITNNMAALGGTAGYEGGAAKVYLHDTATTVGAWNCDGTTMEWRATLFTGIQFGIATLPFGIKYYGNEQ